MRPWHAAIAATIVLLTPTDRAIAKDWPGGAYERLHVPLKEPVRALDAPPAPDAAEATRFRNEFGSEARVWFRRATGGARLLAGFTAALPGSPEDAARAFVTRWSRLLRVDPDRIDLEHRETRRFPTFVQVRFQQIFGSGKDRVDVRDAELRVNLTWRNEIRQVFSSYVPGIFVKDRVKFKTDDCVATARKSLGITKQRGKETAALRIQPLASGDRFVYEVVIPASAPFGTWEVVMDASADCAILSIRDLVRYQHGRVFDPNPIVSARDGSLRATSVLPPAVYRTVTLSDLTDVEKLSGSFADTSPTEGRARKASREFMYSRPDSKFAETMAYYHVTATLQYLQSLALRALKELDIPPKIDVPFRLPVRINAFGSCFHHFTSCFVPDENTIVLGRGGAIPDGEDAHVIVHELGHAVLNHRSPALGGLPEPNSIAEGFADYLALSMFSDRRFEVACFAPWDGSERQVAPGTVPCLRRADTQKTYSSIDMLAAAWEASQVWSATLWDVRNAITTVAGEKIADLVIVEAHSGLPRTASMGLVGQMLLARQLDITGGKLHGPIIKVLEARKIPLDRP